MRLALLIAASTLSFLSANQAIAEETYIAQNVNNISEEVREKCLAAADFEGCVRAFTERRVEQPQNQERKVDFLGKPVIEGWEMLESQENNIVWYISPDVRAINVRNTYGRYIGYGIVKRWYQEAIAGRPGTSSSTYTFGQETTQCYGSGGYASCTTTPAETFTIPGTSGTAATPAGVRQHQGYVVIDCLEETQRTFEFSGGWGEPDSYDRGVMKTNCHRISSLPKGTYSNLAKGKPNDQDKKALRVLPGNSVYDSSWQTQSKPEKLDYYLSGLKKNRSGDYQGAIVDLTKAIEIDPKYAAAYKNRGLAKSNLGNYQEAIADYNKAIEIYNPQDDVAYNNRGYAKRKLGDYQGAIADYTKAIEINPKYVRAYNRRGWTKYLQGDFQGALLDSNKALQISPDHASTLDTRGRTKHALGQDTSACADLKRAVSLGYEDTSKYLKSEEGSWCRNMR